MQARYYDPVIGRFYSNDPVGFRDVHSFNRYAYANNNPYKYVDPNGEAVIVVVTPKPKSSATVPPGYQNHTGKKTSGPNFDFKRTTIYKAISAVFNKSADDAIDEVKDGKKPASGSAGEKGQLEGQGGMGGALDDFGKLPLQDGTEWSSSDGSRQGGTLEDGSKVNVHPSGGGESYPKGTPTLDIQRPPGQSNIKIRYSEVKTE